MNFTQNIASIVLFWAFLGFCAAALALGWGLDHAPIDQAARADLADLHVSLGLSAAALLVAQFLVGVALYIYRGRGTRSGRELMGFWLRQLVFLAFIVAVGAAALGMAYRGERLFFWGYPLPLWDWAEGEPSEPLQRVHAYAAYTLGGAALAYAAFVIFDRLFLPSPDAGALEPATPISIAALIAEGLAHSFRFFGGAAFWLQLFLGVISGVLLGFGFVGHTVSPGATMYGDAIYWATGALAILVLTTLFAFKYKKTAARIRNNPARYLSGERHMAFWFVGLGGLLSVLGLLDAFVGLGLSAALLVGKTVSQPPGIAITDPTKIIRALDIFVLLVNFDLLFAHFIGFGVAAWLSISSLKARHQYLVAPLATK
jgi:cytochrome b561